MDLESNSNHNTKNSHLIDGAPNLSASGSTNLKRVLIILNCVFMALGNVGGPILLRLYFRSGGHRQWLPSWLETAGFPLLLVPIYFSYLHRRRNSTTNTPFFFMTKRLWLYTAVLGVLTGLDDFIYAYGLSFVPVSTSAILISTQLAFTVGFAFLLVRQRLTAASANAVALLTIGAVVLGLHVSSDRPTGVTNKQYWMGFFLSLGAAGLYGFVLPLIELAYRQAAKEGREMTYALVMEMQFAMGMFATLFCTIGVLVNKDFQAIPLEAKACESGEAAYYVILVFVSIFWQFFFLGTVGVIYCVNTLLAGILIAAFIPITEVFGVIFFQEKFSSEKGVALVLSLWGLASYSYGEYKEAKEKKAALEAQIVS